MLAKLRDLEMRASSIPAAEGGILASMAGSIPHIGIVPAAAGALGGIGGYRMFPQYEWMKKYLRHPLVAAALGSMLGLGIPTALSAALRGARDESV